MSKRCDKALGKKLKFNFIIWTVANSLFLIKKGFLRAIPAKRSAAGIALCFSLFRNNFQWFTMTRMDWEVIDTGIGTALENMQFDADLLNSLEERSRPILHFYDWKGDAATFGYFIEPTEFLNMDGVAKRGLTLAKRPTGGGIVFHMWDFAFSVLIPAKCKEFSINTLENYERINRGVLNVVRGFLGTKRDLMLTPIDLSSLDESSRKFCMARPTKYDVMFEGRKIAGAAQRRRKGGFLHQGTIALMIPSMDYLEDVLKGGTKVKEAMFSRTMPLLGTAAKKEELQEARRHLKELLVKFL